MGVGAAISNVRLREETVDLLGMKRQHAPVALVVTALGTIILSIIVSIASGDYYDGLSCLLYTSPSPRDGLLSRMPSSA